MMGLMMVPSELPFASRYGRVHGTSRGPAGVGCCWVLMALLSLLGLMSVVPMSAAAVAVAAEKLWARGVGLSKLLGVAAIALAVAAVWTPGLAPGLHGGGM